MESENSLEENEPGVFSKSVLKEFETLWQSPYSKEYSDNFIIEYRDYLLRVKEQQKKSKIERFKYGLPQVIQPNKMQQEAIVKLDKLRKTGEKKALAIAATGSGKTYMSVFDALQVKPKRLLFIVHREDILHKAKESFDAVCSDKNYSSRFFTGNEKQTDCKYLFATRDSLSRHYKEFDKKEFDYIVLDEAHHATSESYKNILNWFEPEFLLGLTATPDRSDSGDIYSVFDNNVGVEIRLRDALSYDIIAPFHYFGLTDVQGLDYSKLNLKPEDSHYLEEVSKLLMISKRVDYIIEKINFYGHDGEKTKALGFCATVEHARYMADEFNKRISKNGKNVAVALCGEDSVSTRETFTKRLEDENDCLEYIFTVDIFNEGIDIPSTNLILMLRPTDSSIIFIQQLGRGLRKLPGKEFVTVLDFIGNYQKSFLMAIALFGKKSFDKDSLKVAVKSDFADLPNGTYIHMDKIAKEQVLKQLENERFMSMKYMKDSYFTFKQLNGGKVPCLCDYLKHDGAIDPLKFTIFNAQIKTYIEFVASVEKDTHPELAQLLQNEIFKTFMRFIFSFLPANRIEEIVALKLLIQNHENPNGIPFDKIQIELSKHVDYKNNKSFEHSIKTLCGTFYDSSEHNRFDEIIPFTKNNLLFLPEKVKNICKEEKFLIWISDALEYALLRYDFDFGRNDYSIDKDGYKTPFLKLNNLYTMRSVAPLCLYEKIHSSFRGQGLITAAKPDYFLFVNLHKDANVKESINYKDKFLTRSTFQWESPNSTSQQSEVGQNLINNFSRHINLP